MAHLMYSVDVTFLSIRRIMRPRECESYLSTPSTPPIVRRPNLSPTQAEGPLEQKKRCGSKLLGGRGSARSRGAQWDLRRQERGEKAGGRLAGKEPGNQYLRPYSLQAALLIFKSIGRIRSGAGIGTLMGLSLDDAGL